MVTLSVSVGVMAGFLILVGVLLTALSNTGLGNMLALAYTRIVFSGDVVTVKEVPLPFFFSGVLATRGKRALILAAIVAFIRIFLLVSVSYAGFKIQPVNYAKQGVEHFNEERTLVKFGSLARSYASYVDKGLSPSVMKSCHNAFDGKTMSLGWRSAFSREIIQVSESRARVTKTTT
jgi:hypothetical protein